MACSVQYMQIVNLTFYTIEIGEKYVLIIYEAKQQSNDRRVLTTLVPDLAGKWYGQNQYLTTSTASQSQ